MQHVHLMNIRPDVITRSGTVQPYSVAKAPPGTVAALSVRSVESLGDSGRPYVSGDVQPEEFTALAKRIAVAMAQGKQLPAYTDPKLILAARLLLQGQEFTVRSAGRTAYVQGSKR